MLINNDSTFVWKIHDPDGNQIDYSKFDELRLVITSVNNPSHSIENPFIVEDGVLFTFKAADQKATGAYNLELYGDIQGKKYKMRHDKAFTMSASEAEPCIFSEDHMEVISTCISRFLDGRDGRSPYIGLNRNWYIYSDETRSYINSGVLADYSDLFLDERIRLDKAIRMQIERIDEAVNSSIEDVSSAINKETQRVDDKLKQADEVINEIDSKVASIEDAESERSTEETYRRNNEQVRNENERARVSNESNRTSNENERVYCEKERCTNELSRVSEEADRLLNESIRVSSEKTRVSEEAIRVSNETNRVRNEDSRVKEEADRINNETSRVSEEEYRLSNEQGRVEAEQLRAGHESERIANEATRVSDEQARQGNEASRKNSEAARVNNEAARVSGEDVRVRNEASRTSEESTRVSNENARKSNEITRVNAESSRVSAEQSRVTEEGKRAAAETKRQTDTAKAIQDTNTAAQNATNVAAGMEGKIVQIQQDVNTRFTEDEGHIKRESVHPLQGKATRMTTGMYGNLNININQSLRFFVKHNVDSGNYATLFGGIYLGGGTSLSFVTAPGQPQRQLWNDLRGNKLTEIVMTISETTMKLYKNGVLGFEFELTEGEKKAIQAGWRQRTSEHVGVETIHFNHFNYVLSPEEVKELYNNGRPDKVVLENLRKGTYNYNYKNEDVDFTNWVKYNSSSDITVNKNIITTTRRGSIYLGNNYFHTDYNYRYIIKGEVISETFPFELQDTRNGTGYYRELLKQGNFELNKQFSIKSGIICIGGYAAGSIRIDSINIYRESCIAEYLPSSLTPTKWLDTSGNSNHLTAAGTPELIYTPTFVEEITAETAPTTKPDFSGQKWIDKKNNRLFIGL